MAKMLLAGPLWCDSTTGATAVLLPQRRRGDATPAVQSLSLCMLALPSAGQQRAEFPSLLAAQDSSVRWRLTYHAAEKLLRWHITAPAAAAVVLSAPAPAPATVCHVALVSDSRGGAVSLFCNQQLVATATCPFKDTSSSNTASVFDSTMLHVGGLPAVAATVVPPQPRFAPFQGLLSDVRIGSFRDAEHLESTLRDGHWCHEQRSSMQRHLQQYCFSSFVAPPHSRAEPMYSLQQLLAWSPAEKDPLQFSSIAEPAPRSAIANAASSSTALAPAASTPPVPRRRVIHCHDMRGGYTEDADAQHGQARVRTVRQTPSSAAASDDDAPYHAYCFQFWKFIDVFVYFTHARLSIPPVSWRTAAHRNGVQVLGCLCTEWDEGERENVRLLDGIDWAAAPVSSVQQPQLAGWQVYAQRLVQLACAYDFDGWFINIEAKLPPPASTSAPAAAEEEIPSPAGASSCSTHVVRLCEFLSYLTSCMHAARPQSSLVLMYDSLVASDGAVKWQSQLNAQNECFFAACDGLFTDYHYDRNGPVHSAAHAAAMSTALAPLGDSNGPRARSATDVFTGVDLWGRGSYGGGGFDALSAVALSAEAGTSLALFGPAWTYESSNGDRQLFLETERRLWLGRRAWVQLPLEQFAPPPLQQAGANVTASEALSLWTLEQGGDGWALAPRDAESSKQQQQEQCFVTSHKWCTRTRIIDLWQLSGDTENAALRPLLRAGHALWDQQPAICIRACAAPTPPSLHDHYKLRVCLLAADQVTELDVFVVEKQLDGSGEWETFSHTFRSYGSGVRYLRWHEGGKDAEVWAGHFGTRIGAASIHVNLGDVRIAGGPHLLPSSDAQLAIVASSASAVAVPASPSSICALVPRARMPFATPFRHDFCTGQGAHWFVNGVRVNGRATSVPGKKQTGIEPSEAPTSLEWFNMALQDNQTIVVDDLLCDGSISADACVTSGAQHSASADSLLRVSARASIAHSAAFEGGSCFEVAATVRPASPTDAAEAVAADVGTLVFDCFEFGPRVQHAGDDPTPDLLVRFVFQRPSPAWSVALRFVSDSAATTGEKQSQSAIVLDGSCAEPCDTSASVADAPQWLAAHAVLPSSWLHPASSIVKLQVQLRFQPQKEDNEGTAAADRVQIIRLGQICVSEVSQAVSAPSFVLPPPPAADSSFASLVIATRFWSDGADSLKSLRAFLESTLCVAAHVLIALRVDRDRSNTVGFLHGLGPEVAKRVTILPIAHWLGVSTALNTLALYAAERLHAPLLMYQSIEVRLSQSQMEVLLAEFHSDPRTLFLGPALPGHSFEESPEGSSGHVIDGVNSPWNTSGIWHLNSLLKTGFLTLSDGVNIQSSAQHFIFGQEEVPTVSMLQRIAARAREDGAGDDIQRSLVKLVHIGDVTWLTPDAAPAGADSSRAQWHAQKMASKRSRAEHHLTNVLHDTARVVHRSAKVAESAVQQTMGPSFALASSWPLFARALQAAAVSFAPSISCRRYVCADSFRVGAHVQSFLFSWQFGPAGSTVPPAAATEAASAGLAHGLHSFDVFLNARWQARVLVATYFLDSCSSDQMEPPPPQSLELAAPSLLRASHMGAAGFTIGVRANYRSGHSTPMHVVTSSALFVAWEDGEAA